MTMKSFLSLTLTLERCFHSFQNGDIELTKFKKLPMEQIATKLTTSNVRIEDFKDIKSQEEMKSAVKVSDMAEILVSKFKNNCNQPPPEPVGRKVVRF